jgi:transcriptional regulator with XRE-family HTH domain
MVDDESDRTLTARSPHTFGRRLREQRERRQITLEAIAGSTKIKASLFAGLERGDISEWPAGIFQRAFVREYARAIGLAPEPVVAEFVRVFVPDSKDSTPAENSGTAPAAGELRLTLAVEPLLVQSVFRRALPALVEAVCVAAVAAVASWVTTTGFSAACGTFALLYYPLATAWVGCSPVMWYLKRDAGIPDGVRAPEPLAPVAAERRDRLYLVKPAAESEPPLGPHDRDDRADPIDPVDPVDIDTDSTFSRSAAR